MSAPADPEILADLPGTTIGTTGSPARATVTPWGEVVPWDGTAPLAWWVAAEDRWHDPAAERAVRQRRVGGAPVVETLVRVPGGDLVHTAYAVAGSPVLVVVELENRSPASLAVALSRADLRTVRPPSAAPPQGIDAPAGTVVVPVGHRTSVRVALPVGGPPGRGGSTRRRSRPAVAGAAHDAASPSLADLPTPAQVARGWRAVADSSVRVVLPDPELDEAVVAARAALLLDGPADPDQDPTGFLLGVGELVRLGQSAAAWVDDVVEVTEAIGRAVRRAGRTDWDVPLAVRATAGVLNAAGEVTGARDALAMVDRLPPAPAGPSPRDGLLVLSSAAERLDEERKPSSSMHPGRGWRRRPARCSRP
jgi:hypothetical protein